MAGQSVTSCRVGESHKFRHSRAQFFFLYTHTRQLIFFVFFSCFNWMILTACCLYLCLVLWRWIFGKIKTRGAGSKNCFFQVDESNSKNCPCASSEVKNYHKVVNPVVNPTHFLLFNLLSTKYKKNHRRRNNVEKKKKLKKWINSNDNLSLVCIFVNNFLFHCPSIFLQ